eukprot:GDKK01046767.1.p1 GENE.GDKK01046767.1~~GDKK01046767.1.p1  ORF type:complete len:539 (+),score=121.79 GDKK01046767.1:25-1617(+)
MAQTISSFDTTHTGIIHDVDVDFFGKRMVSAASDGLIKIWDVVSENPTFIAELKGHNGAVWMAKWAPAQVGAIIASACVNKTLIIWSEAQNGDFVPIIKMEDFEGAILGISWAPWEYGAAVGVVCSDGTLTVRSLSLDTRTYYSHTLKIMTSGGACTCLSWAPAAALTSLIASRQASRFASSQHFAPARMVVGCSDGVMRIVKWNNKVSSPMEEDGKGLRVISILSHHNRSTLSLHPNDPSVPEYLLSNTTNSNNVIGNSTMMTSDNVSSNNNLTSQPTLHQSSSYNHRVLDVVWRPSLGLPMETVVSSCADGLLAFWSAQSLIGGGVVGGAVNLPVVNNTNTPNGPHQNVSQNIMNQTGNRKDNPSQAFVPTSTCPVTPPPPAPSTALNVKFVPASASLPVDYELPVHALPLSQTPPIPEVSSDNQQENEIHTNDTNETNRNSTKVDESAFFTSLLSFEPVVTEGGSLVSTQAVCAQRSDKEDTNLESSYSPPSLLKQKANPIDETAEDLRGSDAAPLLESERNPSTFS